VTVYDVGSHHGTWYIVSELLEGETLRAILRGGALPVKMAVAYAIQLCQGLAAAHQKGIIHRDLKPENLFVTRDDHLKIVDFGVAKLTEERRATEGTTLDTAPGAIIGTVGYMSPEQVKGDPVDCRSDIFSFGVVLYEMLAGVRPFQGEKPIDILHAIARQRHAALSIGNSRLSRVIANVVDRCLEKEPRARFQIVDDVLSTLGDHVIVAVDPGRGPSNKNLRPDVIAYREPPGWLTWSGLAIVVLILVILLGAWVVPRLKPAPPGFNNSGCLAFDAKDFILTVGEQRYVVEAPLSLDLRPYVGHRVEVSFTHWGLRVDTAGVSRTQFITIRNIRSISATCG